MNTRTIIGDKRVFLLVGVAVLTFLAGWLIPNIPFFPTWIISGLFLVSLAAVGKHVARAVFPQTNDFVQPAYWRIVFLLWLSAIVLYLILLIVAWKGRPGFYYDDEETYHLKAMAIASAWRDGVALPLFTASGTGNGFHDMMSIVYYIFGPHPLIIRMINALFGIWLGIVSAALADIVFPEMRQVARRTFYLVSLGPMFSVWSLSQVRDIQIAFCTAVLFYAVVYSLYRRLPGNLVILVSLTSIYLFLLRPASALTAFGVSTLGLFYALMNSTKRRHYLLLTIAVLIGLTFVTRNIWVPWLNKYMEQYFVQEEVYGRFAGDISTRQTSEFFAKFLSPNPYQLSNAFWYLVQFIVLPSPFLVVGAPAFNTLHDHLLPGIMWYWLLPYWL